MPDAAALPNLPEDAAARRRPGFFRRSIEEVARLETRDRFEMGADKHVANMLTAAGGSMWFVLLNAVWFAAWMLINSGWLGIEPFDPFPFGGLTLAVSLEAIFLAIFVLISQNRQALQADRRARVDLQMNTIAEQEITKVMELILQIHDRLGVERPHDPELEQMKEHTHVERLADAMDRATERMDPDAAEGPDSAVDSEA